MGAGGWRAWSIMYNRGVSLHRDSLTEELQQVEAKRRRILKEKRCVLEKYYPFTVNDFKVK